MTCGQPRKREAACWPERGGGNGWLLRFSRIDAKADSTKTYAGVWEMPGTALHGNSSQRSSAMAAGKPDPDGGFDPALRSAMPGLRGYLFYAEWPRTIIPVVADDDWYRELPEKCLGRPKMLRSWLCLEEIGSRTGACASAARSLRFYGRWLRRGIFRRQLGTCATFCDHRQASQARDRFSARTPAGSGRKATARSITRASLLDRRAVTIKAEKRRQLDQAWPFG